MLLRSLLLTRHPLTFHAFHHQVYYGLLMNKKELVRVGLGILLSLTAIAIIFYFIEPGKALTALREVDHRYLLPLAAISVGSVAARAMAWRTIIPKRLSFLEVFLPLNAGYFLNTILPFRMGEVGRALLLKPSGLDFWQVLPTILVERAVDLLIAIGLFLGALPFIFQYSQGNLVIVVIGVFIVAALTLFYFMVRYQVPLLKWVKTRNMPWPNLQVHIYNSLRDLLSGLSVLADGPRLFRAFAWMLLSWTLAVGFQFFLLRAFLPQAKILWAVFALGAVALGVALPSSPGSLGVYEGSLVAALLVFDIPKATALAYAILSHLTSLMIVFPLGAYVLFRKGIAFKELFDYRQEEST